MTYTLEKRVFAGSSLFGYTSVKLSQHESTRINRSQYESTRVRQEPTRVQHESIRMNTSPPQVNKSQLDQETIIVYRSFIW